MSRTCAERCCAQDAFVICKCGFSCPNVSLFMMSDTTLTLKPFVCWHAWLRLGPSALDTFAVIEQPNLCK